MSNKYDKILGKYREADSPDLTGYALLAGRAGGQTLIGDTASGGNLTLQSTFHATKGKVIFGGGSLQFGDGVNPNWYTHSGKRLWLAWNTPGGGYDTSDFFEDWYGNAIASTVKAYISNGWADTTLRIDSGPNHLDLSASNNQGYENLVASSGRFLFYLGTSLDAVFAASRIGVDEVGFQGEYDYNSGVCIKLVFKGGTYGTTDGADLVFRQGGNAGSTNKGALRFQNYDGSLDYIYLNQSGNIGMGTTDLDGTPAIGKVTIKGSTNDGSTNILVGRDSDEANVFSVDTNGAITSASLTSGKIPVATTGGKLIDLTAQAYEADLKVDYTTGDLDTEAEIITAINATNTKINALITKLEALGLLATS